MALRCALVGTGHWASQALLPALRTQTGVEDAPDPVPELRRLMDLHQLYFSSSATVNASP
ncbi:MAG: hypothetical protein RLN70_10180 [Rhodospirillaceae bacterium]